MFIIKTIASFSSLYAKPKIVSTNSCESFKRSCEAKLWRTHPRRRRSHEPALAGSAEQPPSLPSPRPPGPAKHASGGHYEGARSSHEHSLPAFPLRRLLLHRRSTACVWPDASWFGVAFVGRARFFSTDASTATPRGSKTPAAAAAGGAGGDGGSDGQSGKSEQADAGKPVRRGPVSWLSFLLLLVTGGGITVYFDKEKKRHIEELKNRTSAVKPGQSVGTAAIGGPFKLLNHDGKPATEKDFLGKWTLLYFGFTHCPDICPDELQKMAAAIDKIKEKAKLDIVPVFITVDPERDTVEQVRDYVKEFHPDLIGLTGTTDEIRQVARAYRVYYMKTEEEGSDYLVDHSIVMYLMNPKMEFVKFYGKNYDTGSLADGIIKEIKQHE